MSDTVYVLDQVGIRLVKEKTLISDKQLKRPEQVVGFVSDMQVFKDGVPQPPYLYASYKSDNVTEALEHYNECMGRWADLTGQTTSEIFQRAKTMENKQDVKQNKPGL